MDHSLITFLIALFGTYPLSLFLLYTLPYKQNYTKLKSFVFGIIRVLIGYVVYDSWCLIHVFAALTYSYYLSKINGRLVPYFIFILSLIHLSCLHIHRQIHNPNNPIDLTGPMMIVTIKVSSFAWNIYDGKQGSKSLYAIKQHPSLIEYFGYIFFFPSFLCGPSLEFQDYIHYLYQPQLSTLSLKHVILPSLTRLLYGFFFMVYHLVISNLFPSSLYETTLFNTVSFNPFILFKKLLLIYLILQGFKARLYFVWIISEASCIALGYGSRLKTDQETKKFNAFTESIIDNKIYQWDTMSNVHPSKIEIATSFSHLTREWNSKTHHWLKRYVYNRITDLHYSQNNQYDRDSREKDHIPAQLIQIATYSTFIVSAFWHGFYSGYYLTFISGAILNLTEKSMKKIYKQFKFPQDSQFHQLYEKTWSILGLIFTQQLLAYVTLPFIVLGFNQSLTNWKSILFIGHICMILSPLMNLMASYLIKTKKKKERID